MRSFKVLWLLVVNSLLSPLLTPLAHADSGWFSAILVGKWRNLKTGEHYHFRSDGAYTFEAGKVQKRTGTVKYAGRWRTFNPDPAAPDLEPHEWGLKLHALHRVVVSGSQRRTLSANVGFTLRYEFPRSYDSPVRQIVIDGKHFVREP